MFFASALPAHSQSHGIMGFRSQRMLAAVNSRLDLALARLGTSVRPPAELP